MLGIKRRRAAALILAAALTLGGCGRNDKAVDRGTDTLVTTAGSQEKGAETLPVAQDGSWQGAGGCYKPASSGLGEYASNVQVHGEDIYSVGFDASTDDFYSEVRRGEECIYRSADIRGLACGDDGIWVLDDTTDYSVSDTRKYALVKVGYDKQELFRQDITRYMDYYFAAGMQTDHEGILYMLMEDSVAVFGADGTYLCTIPLEGEGKGLLLGGDGEVYAMTGGTARGAAASSFAASSDGEKGRNKSTLVRLDKDGQTAEKLAEHEGYQLCEGNEQFLYTLLNDEGLYGVTSVGEAQVPIAVWAELGLAFNAPKKMFFMPEGKLLLQDRSVTVVLEPANPSEVKPKTAITMASVFRYSPFTDMVAAFNMSNDKYMIKLVDYSRNEELSDKEAIEALNLDIMSGNYPDLFDFMGLPDSYYVDKGLLEDLYPYMDKDPDMAREDFIALDKLEKDGALYYAASQFYLDSAAGLWSRFGDSYGWSLEKYLEIQSQNSGEVMYNITKEGFLNTMVHRYAAQAVDWKAGTCDFDNPQFIGLLNSVADIRENPEPQNSADLDFTPAGVRLKEGTLIASVWFIDSVTEMAQAEAEAGEKLSFIGWPTPDGSCGTKFYLTNLMGICSKGNREAAWEFVKFVLQEGERADTGFGLSTNRTALKEQIEKARTAYQNNESEVNMDEEAEQRLYDLIDHAVYYGNASEKVVDIIMEESAAFLAGTKTAEETARIIQSRVGILAAE